MEEEVCLLDNTEAMSAQATSWQLVPQRYSTVVSSFVAILGWGLAGRE